MNATINATIRAIKESRNITDTFSVQEIIVESIGDYPDTVALQFVNDKINLVDKLNVGDNCDFNLNIKGSSYTPKGSDETRYFTNLNCWSLELKIEALPEELQKASTDSKDDDLPF